MSVYCVTQALSGSPTFTADNVILDGQCLLTGSTGLSLTNRSHVVIKNVMKPQAGITVTGGGNNQVLNSDFGSISLIRTGYAATTGCDAFAGPCDLDAACDPIAGAGGNLIRGNRVVSTGPSSSWTTVLTVDDPSAPNAVTPTPVWSECNVLDGNAFLGTGTADARFIDLRMDRYTVFSNNLVQMTQVAPTSAQGSFMGMFYYTYNSRFVGNRMLMEIINGGLDYAIVFNLRNNSSFNLVEGNEMRSNASQLLRMVSSGNALDPANNTIRGNRLYAKNNTVLLQAIQAGSQGTLFEGNLIYASEGVAFNPSGLTANATLTLRHNTLVSGASVANDEDNRPGYLSAVFDEGNQAGRSLVVISNLFFAHQAYALRYNSAGWSFTQNNFFRALPGRLIWADGLVDVSPPAGSATSDPMFVNPQFTDPGMADPDGTDFRLQPGSPACGTGGNYLGAFACP